MTAPNSVAGFFSSGGGKGAKFPTVGTTVTGTITAVHPPENQTDFETRQPIEGKFQVRIDLATDERDPADQFDDGSRTLYTKGWLIGAIGDAVRKAGAKEPAVGGTLTVSYTGNAPASAALFRERGLEVIITPVTEFEKLEGCVTCLSVRLRD